MPRQPKNQGEEEEMAEGENVLWEVGSVSDEEDSDQDQDKSVARKSTGSAGDGQGERKGLLRDDEE